METENKDYQYFSEWRPTDETTEDYDKRRTY